MNADGEYRVIGTKRSWEQDRRDRGAWRNASSGDPPEQAFVAGNVVRIYPEPSVTRSAALGFEGYHKPAGYWELDANGAGVAIADDSYLPHPQWAEEATYLYMRYLAADNDERPEIQDRLTDRPGRPGWHSQFLQELGNVESSAAQMGRRVVQDYGRPGPWRQR
jgi:hypothetical protein